MTGLGHLHAEGTTFAAAHILHGNVGLAVYEISSDGSKVSRARRTGVGRNLVVRRVHLDLSAGVSEEQRQRTAQSPDLHGQRKCSRNGLRCKAVAHAPTFRRSEQSDDVAVMGLRCPINDASLVLLGRLFVLSEQPPEFGDRVYILARIEGLHLIKVAFALEPPLRRSNQSQSRCPWAAIRSSRLISVMRSFRPSQITVSPILAAMLISMTSKAGVGRLSKPAKRLSKKPLTVILFRAILIGFSTSKGLDAHGCDEANKHNPCKSDNYCK